MARKNYGELAVDRMTHEALWAMVLKDLKWFEEHGIRGADFPDKERHLRFLTDCCVELAFRGMQLAIGTVCLDHGMAGREFPKA